MAAADDANVPTPAASETPDAATAPAARARSWAEIASAKDEPHRTGPDARAPSRTIPEATGATDRPSHPPLGERSGSAANSLAPPPTPAGLEVVSVSADTVALRWTPGRRGDPSCPTSELRAAGDENGASAHASASVDDDAAEHRYEVQTSGDGRPGTFVTIAPNVPTCAFVATKLRRGSHHLFRVRALLRVKDESTALHSEYTSPSLAVKTEDGPPDAPPRAPALVRATSTTMTVSWHPPDHNGGCRLTRYVVRRRYRTTPTATSAKDETPNDSDGDVAEEVPVWDGCVATLTGLEPATAYAVTVSAKNLVGTSAPSEVLVGTTEPAPRSAEKSKKPKKSQTSELGSEIVPFDLTPPARPGECVATRTTSSEIRLEWAPRAGDDGRRRDFLVEWRDVGPAGRFRTFPGDSGALDGGEWSVASSPARRRRKNPRAVLVEGASSPSASPSTTTTPSSMSPTSMSPSMSPSRPARVGSSSSSSSSLVGPGEEMDCGASSLAGSAPATLYSAAGSSSSSSSASSASWSDRSSSVDDGDSDRSDGRSAAFGSFKRVFLPEGGDHGAVTLEGLRPNRAIQCRIVAVDARTRRESEPGPATVACTDAAPPPAPAIQLETATNQLEVTWRLPIGYTANDDPASAPTAHVLEMEPCAGVRPASAGVPSKRRGRGGEGKKGGKGKGKGGGGKGESSNAGVVPPSEEDAWTVVYEGEAPRALLRDPPCAPGDAVVFRVRCANAAGFGECSDLVRYVAPARAPDCVQPPDVVACAPDAVRLRWRAPANANGSVVVAYRAQMRVCFEGGSGEEGPRVQTRGAGEWVDVGGEKETGRRTRCHLRVAGLRPATTYQFRVAAVCADGLVSKFGGFSTTRTPRANPSTPRRPVVIEVTGTSVTVSFSSAEGGTTTTTTTTTTTAASMRDDDSRMADDSSDEGEDDSRWRQRTVEYRLEVAGGGFVGADCDADSNEFNDGSNEFACAYRCGEMRERMHRIDGLVPGSRIRIRVRAVGDEGGTSVGECTAARTAPASPRKQKAREGDSVGHSSPPGGDGARARATRAAARAAAFRSVIAAPAPAVTQLASSPPRGSLCRRGVQLRRKFRRRATTAYATACVAGAYVVLMMYYSWSQ